MFNYREVINNAKMYNREHGFMPDDPNYEAICEWVRTLPEKFRVRLSTYAVIMKTLVDDDKYDALIKFYFGSKLVTICFPSKMTNENY